METKRKYVPQHRDGHLITIRCEVASKLETAARFNDPEEVKQFLYGMYGPARPDEYHATPLKITYELEDIENVDTQSGTEESETALGH